MQLKKLEMSWMEPVACLLLNLNWEYYILYNLCYMIHST